MKKNPGKKFEEDFETSVLDEYVYLRLKDAGGWGESNNTRFTIKNKCDNTIFTGDYYFMIELKSHLGKSIPKTVFRKDSEGRCYQIDQLYKERDKRNTFAGAVFNFRDVEETYLVHINNVYDYYYYSENRASFPLSWCKENGIKIEQIKKRTRYRYNIEKMVEDVKRTRGIKKVS